MRSLIGASLGALQIQRAPHRVAGAGECGNEAVAFTLLDRAHPAVLGDELGRQCDS